MTLLQSTNNIWRIVTYRDGNRRRRGPTLYVRASCILRAEAIGKRESKCPVVHAAPWNPERESCFGKWIQFAGSPTK